MLLPSICFKFTSIIPVVALTLFGCKSGLRNMPQSANAIRVMCLFSCDASLEYFNPDRGDLLRGEQL